VPLPYFASGPGLPRPLGINFYEQHDSYPGYLLCIHDVSETHYDRSNEPEWFRAALLQIRGAGRGRFPPINRMAILIQNRAEWTDKSTFGESFKGYSGNLVAGNGRKGKGLLG